MAADANMITTIRAPARPHPDPDPVQGDVQFDLSTRAASHAYTEICSPLKDEWDGHVETFPSFILALQMRATEGNGMLHPHGIIYFGNAPNVCNILTNYYSVTEAAITILHTQEEWIYAQFRNPPLCSNASKRP